MATKFNTGRGEGTDGNDAVSVSGWPPSSATDAGFVGGALNPVPLTEAGLPVEGLARLAWTQDVLPSALRESPATLSFAPSFGKGGRGGFSLSSIRPTPALPLS